MCCSTAHRPKFSVSAVSSFRRSSALLATLREAGVALNDESVERFTRGAKDWPHFVLGEPYDVAKQPPIRRTAHIACRYSGIFGTNGVAHLSL